MKKRLVWLFWMMFINIALLADAGIELPENWIQQVGAQYNMSLFAKVYDFENKEVETAESTLAVFDSTGQCCGIATIEDGPCGRWYQMTVTSNASTAKGFILKVLNSADGEIHDIKETIDFASDSIIPEENYTEAPLELHYKPLTADLNITLVQNWNWISFNVQQGERTILEFLENYTQYATNGDIIKSQSGQATFSGGQWYPSPKNFALEPGKMYKLRKQQAGTCILTVNGAPCTGEEPIPVVAGWNWLGYTGEGESTILAFFKEGGFANNDLLKPQSGSQATFSNGKWYGNLTLKPGFGYMLKQAQAGSVDYRNAKEK